MKRWLHQATLAVAVYALAATLPSSLAPMRAQAQPLLLSQNVNFKPPQDVTAPSSRQGGTHRGSKLCPAGLSITPLVPPTNIGLTLTESPTIFVYVPQTSAKIEFTVLNDKEEEVVYEKTFKLDKSGIVGVTIPAKGNNKSLEVGKRYVWSFSLVCDPEDRSGDLVVKGFVQRIEPLATLKSDLANADQMTRLNAYAENGIWYETLATLAQMRRQTPGDARLTAKWTQLLESQGLESVAAQPLVQPL